MQQVQQKFEPHINDYKKKEVEDVVNLIQEYPVIGIVNLENLPAFSLQKIKKTMSSKCKFKFAKKRFIKFALDQAREKQNITQLKEHLGGVPALLFSKEDPFKLYREISKNSSPAPARPGQAAPYDLVIPAGPTNFPAGPMIGELGQLGIKAEVKEGKISIREDKVVAKAGDQISQKVAELLPKFGIEPMKVGLNVTLIYQDGDIIPKEILSITEEDYIKNLLQAYTSAISLALSISHITKETSEILIKKAYVQAKSIESVSGLQNLQQLQAAEQQSQPEPKPEPQPEPQAQHPTAETSERTTETELSESHVEHKTEQHAEQHTGQQTPLPEETESEPNKSSVTVVGSQKSDEEVAQELLKKMVDEAVKDVKIGENVKPARKAETVEDITKFIDKLKDKKSRGEI